MHVDRHTLRRETIDDDGVVSHELSSRPSSEGEARIWLFNQRTAYRPITLRTPSRVLTYRAPRYSETSVLFDLDTLITEGPVTVHLGSELAPAVFTMRAI